MLTSFKIQQWVKHLAAPAHFHLFIPIPLYSSFTDGSIDKPAQMTGLKFPCGAPFFPFGRTLFCGPARLLPRHTRSLSGQQEEDMPLHMHWHLSPSLLIATDSLDGCAKQFGHFLLSLVQFFPYAFKFFTVHSYLPERLV
jgi:hypothetical protein